MFQTISKVFLAISTMTLLAACSGNAPDDAAATLSAAGASPAPSAEFYLPQPAAKATAAAPDPASRSLVASVNVLVSPPEVSESERVAEQLRLVEFEQSFSLEMNRRHQEQAERTERAAIAARAGVLQGPGCEGTEGHAAVECEQSLI